MLIYSFVNCALPAFFASLLLPRRRLNVLAEYFDQTASDSFADERRQWIYQSTFYCCRIKRRSRVQIEAGVRALAAPTPI